MAAFDTRSALPLFSKHVSLCLTRARSLILVCVLCAGQSRQTLQTAPSAAMQPVRMAQPSFRRTRPALSHSASCPTTGRRCASAAIIGQSTLSEDCLDWCTKTCCGSAVLQKAMPSFLTLCLTTTPWDADGGVSESRYHWTNTSH